MTNSGKDYEALTEQVFTRLLTQEQVVAQVERDIKIQGNSTLHQIDVAFQFVMAGTTYRTIVQCKDWSSPVKQEQVLAFQAVLADIPGQPRGIMVSRSGFQEGAKRVAEHHGIRLYELREPKDDDWEGLVRSVIITLHMRIPRFEDVRYIPDEEAVRQDAKALGLTKGEFRFAGPPGLAPLTYASGEPCNPDRILNALVPDEGSGPFPVRHEFDETVYAAIPGSPLPMVVMKAIEATIHVGDHHEKMQITVDHLIAYCFRDVLSGSVEFLAADGGRVRDAIRTRRQSD